MEEDSIPDVSNIYLKWNHNAPRRMGLIVPHVSNIILRGNHNFANTFTISQLFCKLYYFIMESQHAERTEYLKENYV